MSFRRRGNCYFGFVDLTITEVHADYPRFFEGFDMLITCLDSSPQIIELTKWMDYLQRTRWNYRVIGRAVWIDSANVAAVFKQSKTFYGFDEIFLMRGVPRAASLPRYHYTPGGQTFAKRIPSSLTRAIASLKAHRYLADGCGLNYVCESQGVARELEIVAAKVAHASRK